MSSSYTLSLPKEGQVLGLPILCQYPFWNIVMRHLAACGYSQLWFAHNEKPDLLFAMKKINILTF